MSNIKIGFQEKAIQEAQTRLLLSNIRTTFERFKYKEDIENSLKELGFIVWFTDGNDEFFGLKKNKQNIVIFVSWVNGEAWVYFRIEKLDIGG